MIVALPGLFSYFFFTSYFKKYIRKRKRAYRRAKRTMEISLPLCTLFNLSLQTGFVPESYNEGNVCLIFKKDDPSLPRNYRPITLLNSEDKVFERLVFKYLYNHLRDNNILTSLQSGFIPGDSTVNQLTYL